MSNLRIIDDDIPHMSRYAHQASEAEFVAGLQAIDLENDRTAGILVHNPEHGTGFLYRGCAHTLVCGVSGSGKSRGVLGSNLTHWSRTGCPAIVFDPRSELFGISAEEFRAQGYDIKVLDFREPYRGNRYNPLHEPVACLRSNDPVLRDYGESMLLELFNNLIVAQSPDQDDVWTRPGINFLLGLTKTLVSRMRDDEFLTLSQLKEAFNRVVLSMADIKRFEETIQSDDPVLLDLMGISRTTADTTRSGMIAVANKGLALADTSGMCDLISGNDIDIHEISSGKPVVLFIIPSDTSPALDFLVATVLTNMMAVLYHDADHVYGGSLPCPVLMMIDEFANIPQMPSFTKVITNARSRNIRIVLAIQSVSQLESIYGVSASTVIDNCRNIIATNGDSSLVSLINRRVGLTESGDDIITVNMLRNLPAGSPLVVLDGKNPFIAKFDPVSGSPYEIPLRKPGKAACINLEALLFDRPSASVTEGSVRHLLEQHSCIEDLEEMVVTDIRDLRSAVTYWALCKGIYEGQQIKVNALYHLLDICPYRIVFGDAIRMAIMAASSDPREYADRLIKDEIFHRKDFTELMFTIVELRGQLPFLKRATHVI